MSAERIRDVEASAGCGFAQRTVCTRQDPGIDEQRAGEVDGVIAAQTVGLSEIGSRSDQTVADIDEVELFDVEVSTRR